MQFMRYQAPFMPKFVKKARESTEIYSSSMLSGYAKFNFDDAYAEKQERNFTFPETASIAVTHSIATRLQIYAFNRYAVDGVITEVNGALSDEFMALDGKLDNIQITELNRVNRNFYNHFIARRKFLTWAPRKKTTDIYSAGKVIFVCSVYYAKYSGSLLCRCIFFE